MLLGFGVTGCWRGNIRILPVCLATAVTALQTNTVLLLPGQVTQPDHFHYVYLLSCLQNNQPKALIVRRNWISSIWHFLYAGYFRWKH